MDSFGRRVPPTVKPTNYVAGLGRGAVGFTTRSDIGPAREAANTAPGGGLQGMQGPGAAEGHDHIVARIAAPLRRDLLNRADDIRFSDADGVVRQVLHALAEAGGKNPDKIPEALKLGADVFRKALGG